MSLTTAPDGAVYVCAACGRTSPTKEPVGDGSGWDESCMLNAVLCRAATLREKLEKGFSWVAL